MYCEIVHKSCPHRVDISVAKLWVGSNTFVDPLIEELNLLTNKILISYASKKTTSHVSATFRAPVHQRGCESI
jgi:exosome complex RNA-binding protein Rrp42 (RNase PH superfamily)